MPHTLFTVGHSNHSVQHLLALLKHHAITAVYDVRSQPYSRYNPQFNRENLKACLNEQNILYEFLGDDLGARSKDPAHYKNGKVDYSALSASNEFQQGLVKVTQDLETQKIALLCAEKDPLQCHRAILIAKQLKHQGVAVQHILEDGSLESSFEFESRLLRTLKFPEQDLFSTRDELLARAYEIQGEKIAYVDESLDFHIPKVEKQLVNLFTIGFTKKSAQEFFTKLANANVKRLVDIRLNNSSQLAGFAKKDDLEYFLRVIGSIDYVYLPLLAPTKELLDAYKKQKGDWAIYEKGFIELMHERKIEENVSKELLDDACLLCSEDVPNHCHRRLVAEYLRDNWCDVNVQITHLT